MAKTEQEIRGKVGNMVFYKMGSETRVRSTASDFQDADSEGQRSGRSRLRVATLFYNEGDFQGNMEISGGRDKSEWF